MTLRAIAGLVVLNLGLLAVGTAVLFGLRGWRWWSDALRLAGVAYLLGVALLFISLTVELVVGITVRPLTVVLTGVALAAGGVLAGRRRGVERPGLRPPGSRGPRLTIFGGCLVAAILVYLEGVFREGRLAWLYEWDAWRVWTIRAKEIYFAGGLDPELTGSQLIGNSFPFLASYPPGVSALQASAFHAMGSADVVTLHLQHWFLLVGFTAALAGLLARHVRQAFLLPLLLLVLVMPSLTERATWAHADLSYQYLLAIAALLLVLWLEDRHPWRLATATLLLGGAVVTKREGILLAASVVAAALAASWSERRWAWPRLAASVAVAVLPAVVWWSWLAVHGYPGGGPDGGFLGLLDHLDRAWPSIKLVVRTLFGYDLWLLVPVLAIVASFLSLLAGSWRRGVFGATFLVVSVASAVWTLWANLLFEFSQGEAQSPVVRQVGGTAIVLGALTPLLLEGAWSDVRARGAAGDAVSPRTTSRRRVLLPWAIVLTAVVLYPGSMLVGYSGFRLPGGAPPFPSVGECFEEANPGAGARVVLGYEDSYADAFALRRRALATGFEGLDVEPDGCGRVRVFRDDVSTAAAGSLLEEAEAAGFSATLERDPDG